MSSNNNQKTFTTILPPPNITGFLHIGHFLNWSLQDFLIKHKQLNGFKTNWITGIDHAGISMQFVVEKELAKQGINRIELGKEKFQEKAWEWKKHAEKLITSQVKEFNLSLNWEQRRFTLDDEYKKEVKNAFIKLFKANLITKEKRITNWDIKFQTALSDLEVIEKEELKKFYIIKYESTDNSEDILVATTKRSSFSTS